MKKRVIIDGILQENNSNPYYRYFENYSKSLIEIRKYEKRNDGKTWLVGEWRYRVVK